MRSHKVDWPEINEAGNFEFLHPDSLDNFLADLHYGSDIIEEIEA